MLFVQALFGFDAKIVGRAEEQGSQQQDEAGEQPKEFFHATTKMRDIRKAQG